MRKLQKLSMFVNVTKYIAYIVCGVCAAIAGMIMLASLGSAEARIQRQMRLQQQPLEELQWHELH